MPALLASRGPLVTVARASSHKPTSKLKQSKEKDGTGDDKQNTIITH